MVFALGYAGSAAIHKGLGFVLFMWFAYSLPIDDYARFGLLYSLQTGVAALALAGIIETTIGRLKAAPGAERQQQLLNSANLVFLGTALASVLLAILAFSWSQSFSRAALVVAALAGVLSGFFTLQSQLSRIVEKHTVALMLGFVAPLLALGGGLVGFLAMRNSFGFFVGSALGFATALPLVRLTPMGLPGFGSSRNDVQYIGRYMTPFVLVAVVDWFLGYGSAYLVKIFFSTDVVARFLFVYTLSSIMHLIATSLNQAWSPRVFKLLNTLPQADVERENARFYLVQGGVLGLVGGSLLVLLPLAQSLLGDRMSHYGNIELEALLLFAAYALMIPWYHAQNYFYCYASGPALMRISIFSSIAGLALWIGAVMFLGEIGAYVGYGLMIAMKTLTGLAFARGKWGIRVLWQGPVATLILLVAGFAISTLL